MTGGGETVTTTADLSGNYVFTNVLDGEYTVSAAKSGFSFAPASQVVTVSGAGATAATIAASPVTISGAITPAALGKRRDADADRRRDGDGRRERRIQLQRRRERDLYRDAVEGRLLLHAGEPQITVVNASASAAWRSPRGGADHDQHRREQDRGPLAAEHDAAVGHLNSTARRTSCCWRSSRRQRHRDAADDGNAASPAAG